MRFTVFDTFVCQTLGEKMRERERERKGLNNTLSNDFVYWRINSLKKHHRDKNNKHNFNYRSTLNHDNILFLFIYHYVVVNLTSSIDPEL
jgi:hypothetical protein